MRKILRKILREITLKWRNPPRYILERKIFPKIKLKKVLLVGVAHYTADYPKQLKGNDLWTIDIDPKVAKFGAQKHITGNIAEINKYFPDDFFDIILLIGIFGYGLNDKKEAEKTMENCARVLKEKGIFIIQWTDLPEKNPINPRKLKNIKLFNSMPFGKYKSRYIIKKRKAVFEFLSKI